MQEHHPRLNSHEALVRLLAILSAVRLVLFHSSYYRPSVVAAGVAGLALLASLVALWILAESSRKNVDPFGPTFSMPRVLITASLVCVSISYLALLIDEGKRRGCWDGVLF